MELFEASANRNSDSASNLTGPLAEQLRPQSFDQFYSQGQVALNQNSIVKNLRANGYLPNLILWGPPGTGKTTFAKLIGKEARANFIVCNAISTGAKDLREMGVTAHNLRILNQQKTILFIDEIHRLNKSQQDVLLPFTENGDLTLIGATTENPSYELNSALLSRSRVVVFELLTKVDLEKIFNQAATASGLDSQTTFESEARDFIIEQSFGDARKLLNSFEVIAQHSKSEPRKNPFSRSEIADLLGRSMLRYDRAGDEHYNVISAFIKSVRGSSPDAAIYYLARMLEAGEDPVFIARRLVVLASEDIGNADPRGLQVAISGLQAVELVGMPESRICLAQVVTYLASAPKSNRSYEAINRAIDFVRETGALEVPKALRSAQTRLAKDLGYGADYKYSHNSPRGYIDQEFLPDNAVGKTFYEPTEHGFEKNIKKYLEWLRTGNSSSEN